MRIMTNLDTQGRRLSHLIERAGYDSPSEFARAIGMLPVTVLAHTNGTRGITYKRARIYAKKLRTPLERQDSLAIWLLDGKQINQAPENQPINQSSAIASRLVPLLSCHSLEQWRSVVAGIPPMSDETVPAPADQEGSKAAAAFRMEDDSMDNNTREGIAQGDYVFVDTEHDFPKPGWIIVAEVPGHDRVVVGKYRSKSIGKVDKPHFDIVPLNPDYPTINDAHLCDAKIIGRVCGTYRVR